LEGRKAGGSWEAWEGRKVRIRIRREERKEARKERKNSAYTHALLVAFAHATQHHSLEATSLGRKSNYAAISPLSQED